MIEVNIVLRGHSISKYSTSYGELTNLDLRAEFYDLPEAHGWVMRVLGDITVMSHEDYIDSEQEELLSAHLRNLVDRVDYLRDIGSCTRVTFRESEEILSTATVTLNF